MAEKYYLVSSDLYLRQGKHVTLSVEPYEFEVHWWSRNRGVFDGQVFNCELNNYDNPQDLLPNTNIIQVASGRLIELFKKHSDAIEDFETLWVGSPSEFKSMEYKVIRFPSVAGFIDMSKSIIEDFTNPKRPDIPLMIVRTPAFTDDAPSVLRPAEGSGLYVSESFRAEFLKLRMRGMIFRPIRFN